MASHGVAGTWNCTRRGGLALLALGLLTAPARAQDPALALDPLSCKAIWGEVGLPDRADDDPTPIKPVCHLGYITGHNGAARTPDWVLARLTAAGVARVFDRPDVPFKPETAVPPDQRATTADYLHSGMDAGHQAASNDFSGDEKQMIDTFFLSNTVPQQGIGFNRQIWRDLEGLVQKLTRERGEIVVITGPVHLDEGVSIPAENDACDHAVELALPEKSYVCDANDRDPSAVCEAGVKVPAALYKIIYDPQRLRVNAFVMANRSHTEQRRGVKALAYLKTFRVGVSTVEELTGLRFFTALDGRTQRILRESCPDTMLH